MAGTTIDGLNAVTSLTAQDEVPVWDAEASDEPTKKITAQNMAASVKTLGSLVNTSEMNNALAGKQNTLTFDTTPTAGSTNPVTSGGIATAIEQSTANMPLSIYLARNSTATLSNTSDNAVFIFGKIGTTPILSIAGKNGGTPFVVDYAGAGRITAANDAQNRLTITTADYTDVRLILCRSTDTYFIV